MPVNFLIPIAAVFTAWFAAAREATGGPPPDHRPDPPPGDDRDERWLVKIVPEAAVCFRKVLAQLRAEGFSPVIVSGKRSCQEQKRIYQQGRTIPGEIVTHANGCRSWHVQGRAIDLNFPKDQTAGYKRAGTICKEHGGQWGGDFPGFYDGPHLEYHPGLTIAQACPVAEDCGIL